jgi:hypothetical protein
LQFFEFMKRIVLQKDIKTITWKQYNNYGNKFRIINFFFSSKKENQIFHFKYKNKKFVKMIKINAG